MHSRNRFLAAALAAILLGIGHAALAADAEPAEMEPELAAKLAREKAKRGTEASTANGAAKKAGKESSDCGSVDIGNVFTGGRPGFNPREVTVIITGDVINANNKCK